MSQNMQSQKDCEDHSCDEIRQESSQETATGGSDGNWQIDNYKIPKDDKWICIEIKKVEDPQVCDMCEKEHVKNLHVMRHDKYPNLMEVGCIFAGQMTDDAWVVMMHNPELKSNMKFRKKRRNNFPNRTWKKSKKNGNLFIKLRMSPSEKSRVIITNKLKEEYSFIAKHGDNTNVFLCKEFYNTEKEAQLASFDYIWPKNKNCNK